MLEEMIAARIQVEKEEQEKIEAESNRALEMKVVEKDGGQEAANGLRAQ